MKNLKILIIILIIFAVGLTGVIIILGLNNKENEENNTIKANNNIKPIENSIIINNNIIESEERIETPSLTFNTQVQQVVDNSMLYNLSNNINKYFNYIKEGNEVAINELCENNIYTIPNNVKYVVKQAKVTGNEFQNKYYTKGVLTLANGDLTAKEKEVYMILYLDLQNNTYKIETITKEVFTNISEIAKYDDIEILKGIYNNFETEYVDNVKQLEIYLEDYSFHIFNNIEKAYTLLNEEYRNRRFTTRDEFLKYINEKQNQLRNIEIIQYNIDEGYDYTIYKGTDEYGNYYYIRETGYMEYTIVLDNYTMQEDYSNASVKEKIEKNTEKFILMLNSADYTNAYNLLEPTFKANNFPKEQDFINYIKNNWFERNIIASKEVTEQGICVVTIREKISTLSNKMEKQFKVTLGDGMEFTIEFDL